MFILGSRSGGLANDSFFIWVRIILQILAAPFETQGRLSENMGCKGAYLRAVETIVRSLTAIGFTAEAGVQSYVATPFRKAITKP